ncbi:DUF541 domain-containing protein [bacterium]|nr:DUF541 domain-containing protein [bacterium]
MFTEKREKQINYYLKLSATILVLISALFVVVVSGSLARYLDNNSSNKTITVSGYADMNVTPDIRTVYINILGKGANEKVAQADAATKSQTVANFLKAKKIATADIKSLNLSTYPEYKNKSECPVVKSVGMTSEMYYPAPCAQNSVVVGYNTNQSIEVTLRGDAMNEAAEIVSGLTINGVTVQTGEASVENPESLKSDLRAKAIADARKNAEKLAKALGVRLGKVQSLYEDGGNYPIAYSMMKDASISARPEAAPSAVLSNGSQKISSTVSVSFVIR